MKAIATAIRTAPPEWSIKYDSLVGRRSESIAIAVHRLLGQIGVTTLYNTPGSPWENGYNRSFEGSLRDELLDREIFYSSPRPRC